MGGTRRDTEADRDPGQGVVLALVHASDERTLVRPTRGASVVLHDEAGAFAELVEREDFNVLDG
jgi:hypothetical protein